MHSRRIRKNAEGWLLDLTRSAWCIPYQPQTAGRSGDNVHASPDLLHGRAVDVWIRTLHNMRT